jgi:hypothetical protein
VVFKQVSVSSLIVELVNEDSQSTLLPGQPRFLGLGTSRTGIHAQAHEAVTKEASGFMPSSPYSSDAQPTGSRKTLEPR